MMPDKQEQGPDGQGGLQLQADCERRFGLSLRRFTFRRFHGFCHRQRRRNPLSPSAIRFPRGVHSA